MVCLGSLERKKALLLAFDFDELGATKRKYAIFWDNCVYRRSLAPEKSFQVDIFLVNRWRLKSWVNESGLMTNR